MEKLVFDILSYSGLTTLVFAIVAGCLAASLWLLGKIVKLLGYWKDTFAIMVVFYSMKRGDRTFKYKGEVYRKDKPTDG